MKKNEKKRLNLNSNILFRSRRINMSSSNKVKMHYVRGRGRAELIRFVMTLTGVEVAKSKFETFESTKCVLYCFN